MDGARLQSIRRFAFFVPALLADWVAPDGLSDVPWQIELLEEAERREQALHGDAARGFTSEELRALAKFFDAALDAALTTGSHRLGPPTRTPELLEQLFALPRGESCSRTPYRPRRTSAAEGVLDFAGFYHVDVDRLLATWLAARSREAEGSLLRAVVDAAPFALPIWTPDRLQRIADHLAERFFSEPDRAWAERLSTAESTLRLRV